MSTVSEIRDAIGQLSEQDRGLLLSELFAQMPLPHENDPEFIAMLDKSLAQAEAGPAYSVEEIRAMIPQWISESRSRR